MGGKYPGPIRAPRGAKLTAKGWVQEAAMRMLMNNLDPEVAENPEELVVYGGTGKAARDWDAYRKIISTLKDLENDETLLVQSGKAVGVFKTTPDAPRVLLANSLLVPKWATWEKFHELEKAGLMMYGQMTAGSWIYIGTQGILQGTFETFAALGKQHFDGDLSGRFILSGGLGGMGGAQPLSATMNGAVFLGVEIDPERIKRRVSSDYCDKMTDSLDEAMIWVRQAQGKKEPLSIGLVGNTADVLPELVRRGEIPDVVTDQTSAHDPLDGYVPNGMTLHQALELRTNDPETYIKESYRAIAEHVRAILAMKAKGAVAFDYGNNLRGAAQEAGVEDAFSYPGFVPAYIRPLFCEGKGPFRWAALSGDPKDIWVTDDLVLELFPEDSALKRWITLAREKVKFQGLPCRICWLGYGERAKFGEALNNAVADGKISAPVVIGRDHLDCGSVASPNRETENMRDGSDAVADWPILNALLNAVSGASWVSVHHGGGVGIGLSIHAGMVIVADGTEEAGKRLRRVLTNDPGTGVMRHADAGYPEAVAFAKEKGIRLPGIE